MTATLAPGSPSPTDAFFDELAAREEEPLVKRVAGTIRFDLDDGGRVHHWYVAMDSGHVAVSHRRSRADAVVKVDAPTFDGLASGTVNAMAATLRGELHAEGDLGLVMVFQRLFPPPPHREH